MPTTYTVDFANALLDNLTGSDVSYPSVTLGFFDFYFGPQTASPNDLPSGDFVLEDLLVVNALISEGNLSAAVVGVSNLITVPLDFPDPLNSGTVTTARIYGDDAVTPIIDVPVSLLGGGGGIIVETLEAVVGVPFTIDKFEVIMPASFGSVSINTALRNRLLDCFCRFEDNAAALSAATISVYTGAPPSIDDTPTGTLLWQTVTGIDGESFHIANEGSTSLVAPLIEAALATGTAGYVRITKGTYSMQGLAGTDFGFDDVEMVEGEEYSLVDMTITVAGF